MADERARAEEGGLVALAFFFGEADHLEGEGQAPVLALEFAHAGDGHEDAEAAVVLAAVAHGVVVRAGEQRLRVGRAGLVAADHVAHRVDVHGVEAGFAHVACDLLGAGAVRLGQVGHGELALFGIAGVGVHRQLLVPVPHVVAERGLRVELVVEPDFRDAVDVAQRFAQLEGRMVVQAALEGVDDLALGEAGAARPAHGEDERKAELGVVVGVEVLDLRELLGRAIGQAGLALLVRRLGGQRLAHHGLAREFGVGADQAQLLVGGCARHHADQRVLEVRERAEGPLGDGARGDPGRMFVHAVEQRRGCVGARPS